MDAPRETGNARYINIIAMLQADKQELQAKLERASAPAAPSYAATAALRGRREKELEQVTARFEEASAARAALSAEVHVRGAAAPLAPARARPRAAR